MIVTCIIFYDPLFSVNLCVKFNTSFTYTYTYASADIPPTITTQPKDLKLTYGGTTGNTLKANDLEVYEEIMDISTRLITNKSGYNFKSAAINRLLERL